MLMLIQHVVNDSFASFPRYRKQIVWCAYQNLPSGLKPLLPQLLGYGSGQLPAKSLSPDLTLVAECLFIQGSWQLMTGVSGWCRYKGLGPSAQLKQLWRASRLGWAFVVPALCQFLPWPMLLPSLPHRYRSREHSLINALHRTPFQSLLLRELNCDVRQILGGHFGSLSLLKKYIYIY